MDNLPQNTNAFSRILLICISLIIAMGLISAVGYWFLPMVGITVAITAGTWAIAVASIILLSVALLLFFIIPFVLILVISVFASLWVAGVIIFFPITFPIIIPILIILLCVGYLRKNKK